MGDDDQGRTSDTENRANACFIACCGFALFMSSFLFGLYPVLMVATAVSIIWGVVRRFRLNAGSDLHRKAYGNWAAGIIMLLSMLIPFAPFRLVGGVALVVGTFVLYRNEWRTWLCSVRRTLAGRSTVRPVTVTAADLDPETREEVATTSSFNRTARTLHMLGVVVILLGVVLGFVALGELTEDRGFLSYQIMGAEGAILVSLAIVFYHVLIGALLIGVSHAILLLERRGDS